LNYSPPAGQVSTKPALDSLRFGRYTFPMQRLLTAFGALCVLALSVSGIVLLVRHQREIAAERKFAAAGPAHLAREEAAARREGIPLTAHELQQPLPPASQNAAPLYVKLTKLLHDKPLGLPKYAEGMDAFHSYTPAQIAAVRQTLASRQDVMTLVHQAADKPRCVFVRDWGMGPDLMFPEYPRIRQAARLIKTESYLLARDGRYKEAVTDQVRGFRIAKHAASDSVLLSYLVGNASEAITLTGMQSILALAGPNADINQLVHQDTRLYFAPLPLRGPLANEPAVMSIIFQQLHEGQHQGVQWLDSSLENLTSGKSIDVDPQHLVKPVSSAEEKLVSDTIDSQHANYLADMRRMVSALNAPAKERRTINASLLDASAPSAAGGARTLSFILLPDPQKLDEDDMRLKARLVITLSAAAILAQKATTGAFPNALPPGFVDPYTSQPLNYRRESMSGFVVYSVGPTGTFDGGKPGEKAPGQESVFRYPAVPK